MSKYRHVRFNETPVIYPTYSLDEYPRETIDSILYQKAYKRISDSEWETIFVKLDLYKIYEMIIHKDSLHNNRYHCKYLYFQ